jgi:hypothetical protein
VPASSLAVPATLHASLLGRLDRLGPAARNVAQAGAVIGRDFSHELLAAVAQFSSAARRRRPNICSSTRWSRTPPTAPCCAARARPCISASPRPWNSGFPDLVQTRPEILAHHYGEAAIAGKAIAYWHLAGKSSAAKSATHEAIAQLRRGLSLLDGLPETRERNQLELDIHITLISPLMASKGYSDPEVFAVLERANRLVTETGAVGTPVHFSVLYGLWVSNFTGGAIAAALEHATNFLLFAQSQPSSGTLLAAIAPSLCL